MEDIRDYLRSARPVAAAAAPSPQQWPRLASYCEEEGAVVASASQYSEANASAARKRIAEELEEDRLAAEASMAEMEALKAAAVQRSRLEADAVEEAAERSRQLEAELVAINALPSLEQSAAWARKLMGEVPSAPPRRAAPRLRSATQPLSLMKAETLSYPRCLSPTVMAAKMREERALLSGRAGLHGGRGSLG